MQAGIFKTLSKGDDSLEVALGQLNFLSTGPRFAIVGWVWSVLDNCMSGSSYHFAPIEANAKRITLEILYRTPNHLHPLHTPKRKHNVGFDS